MLNHKHILVRATNLARPPKTAVEVEDWLRELVALVDMVVLIEPFAIRCEDLGNEGVTGTVCITTSHAAVHCWDSLPEPFLNFDLYSCKDFSPGMVLDHIGKFGPASCEYFVVDRNDGLRVSETGCRPGRAAMKSTLAKPQSALTTTGQVQAIFAD